MLALQQRQRVERQPPLQGIDMNAWSVAEAAHDINGILSAILGYGENALGRTRRGSQLRRDIERILVAGERCRRLVELVLEPARAGMQLPEVVDLEQSVRDVIDMLAPCLAPGTSIELRVDVPGVSAFANAVDVHRLIMNLATNAMRAMPAGGTVCACVTTERVAAQRSARIGTVSAGECAVLRIADAGTGIAPALLPRIFEPCFTTGNPRAARGLGLSLVRDIVLRAGAAIDVATELGAGSCFSVYFPRAHGNGLGAA